VITRGGSLRAAQQTMTKFVDLGLKGLRK